MKKLYGILGGNFDPIHYGHIHLAQRVAKEIYMDKIIFLPNNYPPHRSQTQTSIIDKINMIQLAINHNTLFEINYLEAHTKKICYTIDTLKKIREKINYSISLCFIIGEDNLHHFHLWKDWDKILFFTHLIICPRHCQKKQLKNWIKNYIIYDYHLLHQKSCGYIFFSKIPIFNVSSTQIRKNFSLGKTCHSLLPKNVHNYITLKKLYLY